MTDHSPHVGRATNEWRDEALRRFPELVSVIRDRAESMAQWEGNDPNADYWDAGMEDCVWSPYALWFELWDLFVAAWKQDPPKMNLIDRVYDYAEWSLDQPEGKTASDDLGTIVCCCFLEEIPTNPKAMHDMPNRFTRKRLMITREIFSYHVGEEGFAEILKVYDERDRIRAMKRSRG